MNKQVTQDICTSCGACCAYFRVSFYWGESDLHPEGYVPAEWVDKLDERFAVMKGTDQLDPRCVCLTGVVGSRVSCSMYLNRPTPCREFLIHGEDGENQRCNQARLHHGLPAVDLGIDAAS
jgi:Fe-S-cluster containining protein